MTSPQAALVPVAPLPLEGASVAVTGDLRGKTTRQDFKTFLALAGATAAAKITRNTGYLVVGENPLPAWVMEAEQVNAAYTGRRGYAGHEGRIQIMNEDAFMEACEAPTAAALGMSVGAMWALVKGGGVSHDAVAAVDSKEPHAVPVPRPLAGQARARGTAGDAADLGSREDGIEDDDDACSLYRGLSRSRTELMMQLKAIGQAATAAPRVESFGSAPAAARRPRRGLAQQAGAGDEDGEGDGDADEAGEPGAKAAGTKRKAGAAPLRSEGKAPEPAAKRSRGRGGGEGRHAGASDAEEEDSPAVAPARPLPRGIPPLRGSLVVITGEIDTMTREQFRTWLARRGAQLGGSVSARTTHLVIARKPGNSKIRDAAKQNSGSRAGGLPPILVMDQTEFFTTYVD